MKIKDIKENRIMPFEIDDEKMKSLFSFYLHKAPTIESKSSIDFNSSMLDERWTNFKNSISNIKTKFVSYSYTLDDLLKRMVDYGLDEESPVNRKTNAFVCKKKKIKKGEAPETECECVLRHMRNSIAHSNVYLSNKSNRKYILFEDYNFNGKLTARILLSQTNLKKLKQIIMK